MPQDSELAAAMALTERELGDGDARLEEALRYRVCAEVESVAAMIMYRFPNDDIIEDIAVVSETSHAGYLDDSKALTAKFFHAMSAQT